MELNALLLQRAEYRLKVTNTGNVTIKFSPLKDTKCENIKPAGAVELKPKESIFYTCEALLTHTGHYTNVGEITGTDEEGKSKTKESNEVVIDPRHARLPGRRLPCAGRPARRAARSQWTYARWGSRGSSSTSTAAR